LAQAIQRGFGLLTSNAKDFADISGVVLKVP
jgi:predicted nucleic acid-binding protein